MEEHGLNICFVGDLVAGPGRRALQSQLPSLLKSNCIDFCVVNAENAVHGLGISNRVISELGELGVDAVTLGNHTFSYKDFARQADSFSHVVVPANVSERWPGNRYCVIEKKGMRLAVINLLGQVSMGITCDSPFYKADSILKELEKVNPDAILVDFHAEATSEKQAMGYYLDGRVSMVVGTHTHVQTADSRVLQQGTGYITDAGMTGCVDSVIGMEIETSLTRFVDKMPAKYMPAEGEACLCGVIAEIENNGRCKKIDRFCVYE